MADNMAESSLFPPLGDVRQETRRNVPHSLRSKGAWAFVALVFYVIAVGMLVAHERSKLFSAVQELERIHVIEETLAKVNTAVAHAILNLQEVYYSAETPDGAYTGVMTVVEAIQGGLAGLTKHHSAFQNRIAAFDRGLERMRIEPGRGPLLALRMSLHEMVSELDEYTRGVRERKDRLSDNYRQAYDAITLIALLGGVAGVILFGGLVALFFSRLVWDIKKLEARALEVVSGYRDEPLEVIRRDELGGLMEWVNRMQAELRHREHQLEISRRQGFHQEKMAALGSLAAAVAHEINNPIAAINGVAEVIHQVRCSPECNIPDAPCRPELILEQTRRISKITRQLSDMSAPGSHEPQLLDLNSIVRNICGFITYDRRFRGVELTLELDPALPAVFAVADHFTQIIMNLLINAADATENIGGRKPAIAVATRVDDGRAVLEVRDNGCGMDASTRALAFEEGFTTKPVGKGSGLGLFMCKTLAADAGGHIEVDSAPGSGTRVRVHLPFAEQGAG